MRQSWVYRSPVTEKQDDEIGPQRHRQQLDAEKRPWSDFILLFVISQEYVAGKKDATEKCYQRTAPVARGRIQHQQDCASDRQHTREPGELFYRMPQEEPCDQCSQKSIEGWEKSRAGSSGILERDGNGKQRQAQPAPQEDAALDDSAVHIFPEIYNNAESSRDERDHFEE